MPRLTIDLEKCLNSGQCAYMQPELFAVDDAGAPMIINDTPEGEELIAKAQDAITMCPSQAISFTEG